MITVFWHRRDLRLHDNRGLYEALQGQHPVLPIFIFDTDILEDLPEKDARVEFIHRELVALKNELEGWGSSLLVMHGKPLEVWRSLLDRFSVVSVYANADYEPYALGRDEQIAALLGERQIPLHTFKDHVIFEKLEVAKADGKPYTVFTPYSRAWRTKLHSAWAEPEGQERIPQAFQHFPSEAHPGRFLKTAPFPMPALQELGFLPAGIPFPDKTVAQSLIRTYDQTRNFPAVPGTSKLGIHFRFGTISIREKARKAMLLNDTFLNELIWRDFYAMILANFPHVAHRSFRPEYDAIPWINDEQAFRRWCAGETGYPIVDAGMRELNATGYMHNRVRMITASFLTKHLLTDWRWGEAYFAEKLLDFDLASNNGGWQWAAGCGTDAAPYFRIFNPSEQQKKFDPDFRYIRKWVPEFGTARYPQPIVDHKMARERCLETYKRGLQAGGSTPP